MSPCCSLFACLAISDEPFLRDLITVRAKFVLMRDRMMVRDAAGEFAACYY